MAAIGGEQGGGGGEQEQPNPHSQELCRYRSSSRRPSCCWGRQTLPGSHCKFFIFQLLLTTSLNWEKSDFRLWCIFLLVLGCYSIVQTWIRWNLSLLFLVMRTNNCFTTETIHVNFYFCSYRFSVYLVEVFHECCILMEYGSAKCKLNFNWSDIFSSNPHKCAIHVGCLYDHI